MTRNQHIYAIKNLINKGIASDDSRITNSLILHYLSSARSLLLKRKLDKDHNISEHSYIRICVELVKDTYHDCNCIPDQLGCQILRSKCKIPSDVLTRWGKGITVKSVNGQVIDKTSITQNDLAQHSLSGAGDQVGWFIEDSYLYILNTLTLPMVIVKGIWADPTAVDNYCGCEDSDNDGPCYDPNKDEFPIDPELVMPMYEMTMSFIRQAFGFPEDNENNTRDTQVTNERE